MLYNYDENERLTSVVFDKKEAIFSYDEKNFLSNIDIITDQINIEDEGEEEIHGNVDDNESEEVEIDEKYLVSEDENRTIGTFSLVSFKYNEKNLLSNFISAQTKDENGTVIIPSQDTVYTYDAINRVVKVNDDNGKLEMTYEAELVTLISENETILRKISYNNSKQQIENVNTKASDLINGYNSNAQLSSMELHEEPIADSNGTIKAQGLINGKEVLKADFSYNPKGLISNIQYSSVKSGNKFVKLDYKSKYPKPTKILTQDNVTFFDYNEDGALIKKTAIKFDKQMRLKANSVTKDDVLAEGTRIEVNYEYDNDGILSSVEDVVQNDTLNYTVAKNGKLEKELRLKKQWWFNWWGAWWTNYINSFKVGWTADTGSINVNDEDVHTAFVGGFLDHSSKNRAVLNMYNDFHADNPNSTYYKWQDVDPTWNGFNYSKLDDKEQDRLITLAHSWGGDSAAKANGKTDLLILVDPIGISGAYYYPSAYVIQLYAMSGTPYGGYYTIGWKYKTISFHFWKCRRHRWHFHCGWRKHTKTIKYPYLKWNKTMAWNQGDWVAYIGGKGWYNSFDRKIFQDKFIKMTAHHEEFEYMLWKMEHGTGAEANNNFGITTERNPSFNAQQTSYDKYKEKFSQWFW